MIFISYGGAICENMQQNWFAIIAMVFIQILLATEPMKPSYPAPIHLNCAYFIKILRRRNLRNQQNWSAAAVFGVYGVTTPLIALEYYQVPLCP
jgi:hypothetical protein